MRQRLPMWEIDVKHEGLNKYRKIRGTDQFVVEQRAAEQRAIWDKMWKTKVEKDQKILEKEHRVLSKQSKLNDARDRTVEANNELAVLQNTLIYSLESPHKSVWDSLKNNSRFSVSEPSAPALVDIPVEPEMTYTKASPTLGILDMLIPSRRRRKVEEANKYTFEQDRLRYESACSEWEKQRGAIINRNADSKNKYQLEMEKWREEKKAFGDRQKEHNEAIKNKQQDYLEKVPEVIMEYCDLVLSKSVYPDYFPQEFELDYNPDNKLLVVEYFLPSIDNLPKIKEVKYNQSKELFIKSEYSESFLNKLYDDLTYKIVLRTLYGLLQSDSVEAIDSVVFNGWVRAIDKATGKELTVCILSIQVSKQEFMSINLKNVDPKTCFKSLKGVGSSKLFSLTPIAPIMSISREDKRFISSYDVMDGLDESMNLAIMDWEDFEHLIRELFGKEFAATGGEVKITRASRDSGVDAVAFDPDPIRGGKIVIQAKRYTNTVGVSAVRDLYGTVMNEGATKGILVSTTDYGPDAYEFAKGKPLTLLNGSNLLHLLEKHGHKAIIDLKAAKKLLSEKERAINIIK